MKILKDVVLSETEFDIIRQTLQESHMQKLIAHITADIVNEYGDMAQDLDFQQSSDVTARKQWFVKGAVHVLNSIQIVATPVIEEDTQNQ